MILDNIRGASIQFECFDDLYCVNHYQQSGYNKVKIYSLNSSKEDYEVEILFVYPKPQELPLWCISFFPDGRREKSIVYQVNYINDLPKPIFFIVDALIKQCNKALLLDSASHPEFEELFDKTIGLTDPHKLIREVTKQMILSEKYNS